MNARRKIKSMAGALAAVAVMSSASVFAADLLLDFQLNEGEGLESFSSTGTKLTLGDSSFDPAWSPTSVADDSFKSGDRAANFDGNGWLRGAFEGEPVDLTQPLTWESWVYVDEANAFGAAQDMFNLADTLKVGFTSEGKLVFTARAVKDVTSTAMVGQPGYWTHIACAWEPGVGVTFYENGGEMEMIEWTGAFRAYQPLHVLSLGSNNAGGSTFMGKLNRVRLHKGILADSQLDSDPMNPKAITANTIFSYDFDTEGTTFEGAGSFPITLESGTEWKRISTQIQFSKSTPIRDVDSEKAPNDYSVYIDNSNPITEGYANQYGMFSCDDVDFGDISDPSFTLEAWFKGLARSSVKQVFFQTWSSTTGKCPRLAFAIYPDFTVYLTTMAVMDIYTGAKVPEDGGWHHIAVAFDAVNKKLNVYVDGKLDSEARARENTASGADLTNFNVNFATQGSHSNYGMIGCEHSTWAPFTGYVDRVRLWKGVLTADQLDYEDYGEAIVAPIVKTDPTGITIFAGTPYQLKAEFVGTSSELAPLTQQWYKDGEALEGETGKTLDLVVSDETAGKYLCRATNAGGSTDSKEAIVSVDKTEYASELLLDMQFNEGKGTTTTSSVNGNVADMGDRYVYDPATACSLIADSFFPPGDKVYNATGSMSWLQGTSPEALLDLTQAFTWETWIYVDENNTKAIQGYATYGGSIKIGVMSDNKFVFTFYGVKDYDSGIFLPMGEWTHVGVAWEPHVGIHFYQNGVYEGTIQTVTLNDETGEIETEEVPAVPTPPCVINIGAEGYSTTMFGKLNRIRLHKGLLTEPGEGIYGVNTFDCDPANPRPLTDNTVLALEFNEEALPAANAALVAIEFKDMGESAVETLNNTLVNWSTDTPTGAAKDRSLRFSGSAWVTIPAEMPINLMDSANDDPSFTIEAWIKGGLQTYRQILFSKFNGTGCFSFSINSNYSVFATTYGIADLSSSAMIPQDGDWHHVAFTLDYLNSRTLFYVDGLLSDVKEYKDKSLKYNDTVEASYIGSELNGGSPYNGLMDRLRLHKGVVLPTNLDYKKVDPEAIPSIKSFGITESSINEGAGTLLTVVAEGVGTLYYQWYRNGIEVEGQEGATLEITEAALANAGIYTVKVSNDNGGVMSDPVNLVVNPTTLAVNLLAFPFDEGEGYSAASAVGGATAVLGFGNPEEITNAVLVTEDAPSAIAGDGAATLLNGAWLLNTFDLENPVLDLSKPFTWEAWVYRDPADTNTYSDFLRIGNTVKFGMNTAKVFQATYLGVADINSATITVDAGVWMHLAAVCEPGVGATFYKDGIQVGDVVATTGLPKGYQNNIISLGANTGGSPFDGKMDRVRLHQAILAAADLDCEAANPKPVTENTILAYNFNEEDSFVSEGSNPLVLLDYATVVAPPQWVEGPSKQFEVKGAAKDHALYLNGLSFAKFNTEGVNFGDTEDMSFSMDAWIKGIPTSTARQVFFQMVGNVAGTCPRLSFSVSAARTVHFTTLGIADFDTGVAIPDDSDWHNIAVAYNHPAKLVSVYIDGALAGCKAYGYKGVNFAVQTTDLSGCVGRELGGSNPTVGVVDRIRVWKGIMSPAQLDYPPAPVGDDPVVTEPELEYGYDGTVITLTWTNGVLESSDSANGDWAVVNPATSGSEEINIEAVPAKYYRVRAQ